MGISTQTIGLAIGWLAIAWVALQSIVFSVRTFRRRIRWQQNYVREKTDFRRRIDQAARAARATQAIPDWSGWRSFRVAAIVDESNDVKSFYFTPTDGRPLSPFAPGQYLTFRLPVAPNEPPQVRCYSLSDRPRQDFYRTTIKRVAAPNNRADLPAGRGSNYFHDCVKVGDVLEIRAPAGTFFVDPLAKEPIVLLGAGIGVTPLVSMLEAIVQTGSQRVVYALFGFRSGREHPFKSYLERLTQGHSNIHLHISYSSPHVNDVLYRDYNHAGRMTIERIREVLPSNNFRFYVCGPGPLMESLVPALWDWGVPESHVHYEAFGPASVKSASHATAMTTPPCEVRFGQTGRIALWDGSFATLLEFGEAHGVTMPSGCRAGSCGECLTRIRSGKVATVKQPGIAVPAEHCLACISVPAGPVALEA